MSMYAQGMEGALMSTRPMTPPFGYGGQDVAATLAEPASPFERLSIAVQSLLDVANHSDGVADRVCGSRPPEPPSTAAGGMKGMPSPDGLLNSMDEHIRQLRELTRRISHNLSRVSERL